MKVSFQFLFFVLSFFFINETNFAKAYLYIIVTEEGSVISSIDESCTKLQSVKCVIIEVAKTLVSDVHPSKTLFPISVTVERIVIFVNDEYFKNAPSPISVTVEGIVISVNDEHSLKVYLPIEVTEEGIAILINDDHPLKALLTIEVTEKGITVPST